MDILACGRKDGVVVAGQDWSQIVPGDIIPGGQDGPQIKSALDLV